MINLTTEPLAHQKFIDSKFKNITVHADFSEMGVGKTLTSLMLGSQKVNAGKAARIVMVGPVSGLGYLQEEINKHTNTPVFNAHQNYYSIPESAEIVLIGMESLSQSVKARKFYAHIIRDSFLVIDESHMAKNPTALRTNFIQECSTLPKYKHLSSGTPMTNGLKDIYTQMRFLHPQILRYHTFDYFARNHLYRDDHKRWYGSRNIDYIIQRIHPYTVRFSKKDCLDLPPKTYSYSEYSACGEVQEIYQLVKKYYLSQYLHLEDSPTLVYRLLLDLHKVSCGIVPQFLEFAYSAIENPKIPGLIDYLLNIDNQKNIVIWCRFVKEINQLIPIIETETHRKVFRLDGSIPVDQRKEIIHQARSTPGSVLVGTPNVGGICITLDFIEYAIYFSNSFDYGHRIQSEDRIHRLGMQGNALYHDLGIDLGIDKKIRRCIKNKRNFLTEFLAEIKHTQYQYKSSPEQGIKLVREKILAL